MIRQDQSADKQPLVEFEADRKRMQRLSLKKEKLISSFDCEACKISKQEQNEITADNDTKVRKKSIFENLNQIK